jgi:hypothetical protein
MVALCRNKAEKQAMNKMPSITVRERVCNMEDNAMKLLIAPET